MSSNANWPDTLDPALMTEAEKILSEAGLTLSEVFTMLMQQIVRDRSIPLSLMTVPAEDPLPDSTIMINANLLEVRSKQLNGSQVCNLQGGTENMKRVVEDAKNSMSKHIFGFEARG